ncbi:P-loop NTPase fold protein (plasmid) [Mycolicibacterium psychrotolerans]|uniref:P-loop NTPase fold protein n=1 Tax=Mycolicibacterium psychrotolerans TaxID=216929 RepID=UPI003D67510D
MPSDPPRQDKPEPARGLYEGLSERSSDEARSYSSSMLANRAASRAAESLRGGKPGSEDDAEHSSPWASALGKSTSGGSAVEDPPSVATAGASPSVAVQMPLPDVKAATWPLDGLITDLLELGRFDEALQLLRQSVNEAEGHAAAAPSAEADAQLSACRRQLAAALMLSDNPASAMTQLSPIAKLAYGPFVDRDIVAGHLLLGQYDAALRHALRSVDRDDNVTIWEYRHYSRLTLTTVLVFGSVLWNPSDAEPLRFLEQDVEYAEFRLTHDAQLLVDARRDRDRASACLRQLQRITESERAALLRSVALKHFWMIIRGLGDTMYSPLDGLGPGSPTAPRFVAGLIPAEADAKGATDHLGIDFDAQALAALIANRAMKPPLAIGVYGQWGSGKTFFMRRLQHWVDELQKAEGTGPECVFEHGVVPIWFSAWHYSADPGANLWASLVSHIFAELSGARSDHQIKIEEVLGEVDAARRIRDELDARLAVAQGAATKAAKAAHDAKTRYRAAVEEAAKLKGQDVLKAIDVKTVETWSAELTEAAKAVGIDTAASSVRELSARSREISEFGSRITSLAIAGPWYRSPLAIAIAVILVVSVGGWALLQFLDIPGMTSTTAAEVSQFSALCLAIAGWIARQAVLMRKILRPAEAVQRKIDERVQAERAKQQELIDEAIENEANVAAEVNALTEQHARAVAILHAAEAKRESLTGQELLRRYLSERAGSGDYDRFKGVVALAHHDLEQLSEHLTAAVSDGPADEPGVRRIVLYIDDLDRCDAPTVADTLAAVHLLLALPLFTVIVGVDPRWLRKSLNQTHNELFSAGPAVGAHETTPVDYLEKIFQLTYTLPAITSEAGEGLIMSTLRATMPPPTRAAITRSHQPDSNPPSLADDEIRFASWGSAAADGSSSEASVAPRAPDGSASVMDALLVRVVQALTIDDDEVAKTGQVATLVATTPRRAKRFLSTYLVLRARVATEMHDDTASAAGSDGLLMAVALMIGARTAASALFASSSMSEGVTVGQWIDDVVDGSGVPEGEIARLRAFRGRGSELAKLPLARVRQWRHTAAPYLMAGGD